MYKVSRLFIMVDPVDEEDELNLKGIQMWEDGVTHETDMAEIIIILANRSTCPGGLNEGKPVFSYMGHAPFEREKKISKAQ